MCIRDSSGSGNVAQYAVQKATQLGGKVVTLSDSSGYIYDPKGIDEEKWEYVLAVSYTHLRHAGRSPQRCSSRLRLDLFPKQSDRGLNASNRRHRCLLYTSRCV